MCRRFEAYAGGRRSGRFFVPGFQYEQSSPWIMADLAGLAAESSPTISIPNNLDAISNPKSLLLSFGSRPFGKRKTTIFRDQGDYTTRVIEFVAKSWSVERAVAGNRSQSLK